jgi:hypothetical protein
MCYDPIDTEHMKVALHARIGQAIAKREVDKDWSNEPPPFQPPPPPSPPTSDMGQYGQYGGGGGGGGGHYNSSKNSRKDKNNQHSQQEAVHNKKRMQRAGRFQDDHLNVRKRKLVSLKFANCTFEKNIFFFY